MKFFETGFGRFILGDARLVVREIESESVDAVITDPPYKHGYEVFFRDLLPELHRVLKPGGWLAFYWPTARLDIPFRYGIHNLLTYRETVIVIYRRSVRYSLLGRKNSILVLMFSKGEDAKLLGKVGDIIMADEDPVLMPVNPKLEEWRPTHPSKLLVHMLTKPGDLVLDPMAGYGSIPLVCEHMKRRWIAIEVDESRYTYAEKLIKGGEDDV